MADSPGNDMRYVVRHLDRNGNVRWVVSVNRKDAQGRCVFSAKDHGSPEQALEAACQWRDMRFPQITANPPPAQQAMRNMRESAQLAGVTCLDAEWLGAPHRYRFRCQHGHEWTRTGSRQRRNPRCLMCANDQGGFARRRPCNLDRLREVALARGGQILDDDYLGSVARYHFRCTLGHEWAATGHAVLRGTWCRLCFVASKVGKPMSEAAKHKTSLAKLLPDGLQRLQRQAESRGGSCLSDQYTGSLARYRFRCAAGHEWETRGGAVQRGKWCSLCHFAARRFTLEVAQRAANARGGRCLSTSYVGKDKHLTWECDRGHS